MPVQRLDHGALRRARRALLEELALVGRADGALVFSLADVDGARVVADGDFVGHGSAGRVLQALAREPGLLPARLVECWPGDRAASGSFLDGASTRWSRLLAGTEFRRQVLAPLGIQDLARHVVLDGDRLVGCVVALRRAPERSFSRKDRQRLEKAAERLDRDLRAIDATRRASHPQGRSAFLVVRGEGAGEIDYLSPEAESWCAHPEFPDVLEAAIRQAPARDDVEAVSVVRLMEIRIVRLGGTRGAGWLVRVSSCVPAMRNTDGALSPVQRVVARGAADGATISEIAESMGRAPETVRSHLRAAYARLGVSSRVELARRLGR